MADRARIRAGAHNNVTDTDYRSTINYSGASAVEIDGGAVNTAFAVQSTAAGTPVTVRAGRGGNPFRVGAAGSVKQVRSAVALAGGGSACWWTTPPPRRRTG